MFVVTARNIALGLFPSMLDACAAILLHTDPDAVQLELGEWHAVYWSPKHRCNFHVVFCRPSTRAEPLFRE